jgi:hypothetical protein
MPDNQLDLFIKLSEELRGSKLTEEEIEAIRQKWGQMQAQLGEGAPQAAGQDSGQAPGTENATGRAASSHWAGSRSRPGLRRGQIIVDAQQRVPTTPDAPDVKTISPAADHRQGHPRHQNEKFHLPEKHPKGTRKESGIHIRGKDSGRAGPPYKSEDGTRQAERGQVQPFRGATGHNEAERAGQEAERAHEEQLKAAGRAYETMVRHNERNIELHEKTAAKLAEQERKLEQISRRVDNVHRNQ